MTSRAAEPPQRLADTDWLHHRLEISGPGGMVAAFALAARGAGIIPWQLDLDRIEEDLFRLHSDAASVLSAPAR